MSDVTPNANNENPTPEEELTEPVEAPGDEPTEVAAEPSTSDLDAAIERAHAVDYSASAATPAEAAEAATDVAAEAPVVAPSAPETPTALTPAAVAAPEWQPAQTVYVQAPTPPKRKGNRGFGVFVALVGAVVFAALFAAAGYLLLVTGHAIGEANETFVKFLTLPAYWVPVIAAFVGYVLVAVIVNRGAWWAHAVLGILVGVLVYFSFIGGALITQQAWTMTYSEAIEFLKGQWLNPGAILAGVIAREVPIWLGGWIARRGRSVTEKNKAAYEAYERDLAAGPRLSA